MPEDTEGREVAFCIAEKNKNNRKKKKGIQSRKYLKGCHQGQNITVLVILERLELNMFFVGQPWWSTIVFSVLWPLHFKIYFADPAENSNVYGGPSIQYTSWKCTNCDSKSRLDI